MKKLISIRDLKNSAWVLLEHVEIGGTFMSGTQVPDQITIRVVFFKTNIK